MIKKAYTLVEVMLALALVALVSVPVGQNIKRFAQNISWNQDIILFEDFFQHACDIVLYHDLDIAITLEQKGDCVSVFPLCDNPYAIASLKPVTLKKCSFSINEEPAETATFHLSFFGGYQSPFTLSLNSPLKTISYRIQDFPHVLYKS